MRNILLPLLILVAIQLNAQKIFELEESHDIQSDGTLYLETNDADVSIKATDRSDVSIDIYREVKGKVKSNQKFEIEIFSRDGDLYVREKRESNKSYVLSIGAFSSIDYTVKIEIPRGVSLDIQGDDDDYVIKDIVGNIKLNAEDGDLKLSNVKQHLIDLYIEDGDIEMEEISGELKLVMEDGETVIRDANLTKARYVIEDGDIEIHDSTIDLMDATNEDGSILLRECYTGDISISTEDGDVSLYTEFMDDASMDISANDGDIALMTKGKGYRANLYFEDGDVDLGSGYHIIKSKKRYKEVETEKSGNVQITIKVDDGDISLSHK